MKVLMIELFYPENTYTQELGSAMSRYMDVTIACKKHVPLPGGPVHWKGLVYEGYHGRLTAPFLYGLSLLQIAREIRRGHYDVVNIQYMRSPKYEIPFFRAMKKHCGILVNTIHTILPHEASQEDRALHQQLYDLCDLEIVHNTPCKRQVSRDYRVPEEKICVIPHGVYTRGAALPAPERRDGRTEFLMFGQMRKYKGIDVMLEALSLLPAEVRQKVHVTVAGPQYIKIDNTDYEEMARSLGVEDCVSFLRRHIPPEEHPALFAGTDICLFPYKELYGSGALLMAYTYEKPVIVSEDPIFREETDDGKTGLLFTKNDPQALADAMVKALAWDEGEYDRYREHIRLMAKEKYSWDRAARILQAAFEEALRT